MEKLIPFDFAKFQKDPSRLRWYADDKHDGGKSDWAEPVRNCVVAQWDGGKNTCVYTPKDFYLLRLAAETVKVRLYRNDAGRVFAMTDEYCAPLDGTFCRNGWPWVSDIIEVEVES